MGWQVNDKETTMTTNTHHNVEFPFSSEMLDTLGCTSESAEDVAIREMDEMEEWMERPFTTDDKETTMTTETHTTTIVGEAPASTGTFGHSSADDVTSNLAEALGGFSPMPDLPEWRLVDIAEQANSTRWNDARRALEDDIASGQFEANVLRDHTERGLDAAVSGPAAVRIETERARKLAPWREDNPAHLGQAWLSVTNDPRDDRVFAYITGSGQQRLLMVTDTTPLDEYATWTPTGFRDVPDAVAEMRLIRQAVRAARDSAVTDDFGAADNPAAITGDDF